MDGYTRLMSDIPKLGETVNNVSSYSQLTEWLETNPWWGFVGFIMAILGFASAIIIYIKVKNVKSPCYAVQSRNIVRDLVSKIDSLEMLYSGKPIENLTVTKIAFWNAGRDTINSQDIASTDPLTVHVKKGCKILDTKVLYTKKLVNLFSITTADDQSNITLNFEYLDKDEGAVIQILHTGKSSEDIEIRGTIKGAGKLAQKHVPRLRGDIPLFPSLPNKMRRLIFALIYFLFPIPVFVLMYLYGGIDGMVAGIIILIFYWGMGLHIIKRRLPKGFDVFEE